MLVFSLISLIIFMSHVEFGLPLDFHVDSANLLSVFLAGVFSGGRVR